MKSFVGFGLSLNKRNARWRHVGLCDEYLYRFTAISSNMAANSAQDGPTLQQRNELNDSREFRLCISTVLRQTLTSWSLKWSFKLFTLYILILEQDSNMYLKKHINIW